MMPGYPTGPLTTKNSERSQDDIRQNKKHFRSISDVPDLKLLNSTTMRAPIDRQKIEGRFLLSPNTQQRNKTFKFDGPMKSFQQKSIND